MSLAKKLVAPQLRDLQPYQSARRIGGVGQVYLNANESAFAPYEMPVTETWNRYPDFLPTDLTNTYARYAGVNPDRTMAVRGADEAIDLLIRTF
ncbi:MAG: histidinol-phosphate transaminase, partial [Pseudomonadales bacterium]|nr:histidinol-phosphate transaminase [Pseudomonadales bacterium]